jgi:hypothetical protein
MVLFRKQNAFRPWAKEGSLLEFTHLRWADHWQNGEAIRSPWYERFYSQPVAVGRPSV